MANDRKNGGKNQEGIREAGREAWKERKLEKAKRDDIDVISRRTMDQGDFIGILNSLDYLLYQLRMNMGRNRNITFDKAQEFIERSQKVKEDINLLNAEMCRMMGYRYKPPRGFRNPLAEMEEKVSNSATDSRRNSADTNSPGALAVPPA